MQYRDYEEAKKEVAVALVMQPDHPIALQMNADLTVITTGVLPPDLKITGARVPLFIERAVMLWDEGRQNEAVAMMESLYKHVRDELKVVSQLVVFYLKDDKEDKAKEILTKAQETHKDAPAIVKALKLLDERIAEKRKQATAPASGKG